MQVPATTTRTYVPPAGGYDEKAAALYRQLGLTAKEVRKIASVGDAVLHQAAALITSGRLA